MLQPETGQVVAGAIGPAHLRVQLERHQVADRADDQLVTGRCGMAHASANVAMRDQKSTASQAPCGEILTRSPSRGMLTAESGQPVEPGPSAKITQTWPRANVIRCPFRRKKLVPEFLVCLTHRT